MKPTKKRASKDKGISFKRIKGQVTIKNGRIGWEKPMVIKTPEGPLSFDGYVDVNMQCKLKGTWTLNTQQVGKWFKKSIKKKEKIPVTFGVEGPLSKPRVTNIGAAALIGVVAVAYGASKLTDLLTGDKKGIEDKKKKLKQISKSSAKDLKQNAQGQLKSKQGKAKKKAKQKVGQAKKKAKKAKKKAKKAKKKAKKKMDQAKKALKGLF